MHIGSSKRVWIRAAAPIVIACMQMPGAHAPDLMLAPEERKKKDERQEDEEELKDKSGWGGKKG